MPVSANGATFTWDTEAIGQVRSLSMSSEKAQIDTTIFGADAFRTFIAGKHSTTLSATVLLTYSGANHDDMLADYKAGTIAAFVIDFKDGSVAGSGFITSLEITAELDEPSTVSLQIQVTTDLTFADT